MKKEEIAFLKKSLALAAVLLVFLAGIVSAKECGTGIADCECGDTVAADWTFTEDLSCPPGHGLIVGANGITIDGQTFKKSLIKNASHQTLEKFNQNASRFKITGSETADACEWVSELSPEKGYCGILNKGYDDVVIKNLEIENFCTGIALQGSGEDPVVNNTINNCEVHHNGNASCSEGSTIHGVHACFVSECTISNNSIHHNTGTGEGCAAGGNGIFLYAGSMSYRNNVITGNELYDNIKDGFFTKMKLHHARITDNNVYGNGQGGIVLRCKLSNYNLIEGNNASCNYGDGIFIGGQNNTIRNNVVRNNIAGFKISPRDVIGDGDGIVMGRSYESHNNTIISNEVCGNEGVDIKVELGCSGNHGRDNTCDTMKNYDDEGTTGCSNACPEEINAEELSKELAEQGWVMYGAGWCGYCKKQKAEFGDAFQYVNYVDCGPRENPNPACIKENITSIPCWVSPNGTRYGYNNLAQLSELAAAYRAAQQPMATPISTPATPGFESVPALVAIVVVTLSFFFKEIRKKNGKRK